MTDILLTIHCATADTEALVEAIRTKTHAPIHVRAETVHGRDFADAKTSEQVMATLKRSAIEFVDDVDAITIILQTVNDAKRQFPVRWHQTPVLARGRFA